MSSVTELRGSGAACRTSPPVDAMVGDLGSAKIHDLGEVDLVAAVGVRSGVFPHQGLAIEVIAAGAVPAHEVVGAVVGSALEERPDLLSTGEHAALLVDMRPVSTQSNPTSSRSAPVKT